MARAIKQADIKSLIALDLQIARIEKLRDRARVNLFRRLAEGELVEPGIHTVEIKTTRERGRIVEQLEYR